MLVLEFKTARFLQDMPLESDPRELSAVNLSPYMNDFNESWGLRGEKPGEARSALSYEDACSEELAAGSGVEIWLKYISFPDVNFKNYNLEKRERDWKRREGAQVDAQWRQ